MRAVQPAAATDTDVLRAGSRLLWNLIVVVTVAVVAAYWAAGLSIDYRAIPVLPLCAIPAILNRFQRTDNELVYAAESIAQIILISFLGAAFAYAAATLHLPYRDAELIAADHWLGLDLRAYIDFVDARPWLAGLSAYVYCSMMWQPVVVFVVLMASRNVARLQVFSIALIISLLVTIAIFAMFPALGFYGYANIDPDTFHHLRLFWNFAGHLEALRSGALRAIPLNDIRGIVSFPSYHTAAAVLAVWAVWPARTIRWPMLVLNALMAASAPIEGAHYFVDIIGGALVGTGSVMAAAAVGRLIKRHSAAGAMRPAPAFV